MDIIISMGFYIAVGIPFFNHFFNFVSINHIENSYHGYYQWCVLHMNCQVWACMFSYLYWWHVDCFFNFRFILHWHFRKASYVFGWDIGMDSVQTPSSGKLYINVLPLSITFLRDIMIYIFFQIMTPAASASSPVPQLDFLGELCRQMHGANPSFSAWWLTWIIK